MNKFDRKSFNALMILFAIYALLVATHKGEFWPFSIYPMFSQAGKPWTRALVQDVSQTPENQMWEITNIDSLYGPVVNLNETNVEQIDFANFVSKTKKWDRKRKKALQELFTSSTRKDFRWMVTKVHSYLTKSDSVVVDAIPFLLVTPDSIYQNPNLPMRFYDASVPSLFSGHSAKNKSRKAKNSSY